MPNGNLITPHNVRFLAFVVVIVITLHKSAAAIAGALVASACEVQEAAFRSHPQSRQSRVATEGPDSFA